MSVVLRGVSRAFGDVVAVDAIDLELADGALTSLVGPSGCGKTTTLRLIAGFDQPDAGEIVVHGTTVVGPGVLVPPEQRRIGVVFQHLALFPHLDVGRNIAYGLRHLDKPQRAARVDELLELVGLPGTARRLPHELSGGMAQRVAVARALAPEPRVVLLDEPFSSLDVGLRAELRAEIRRILRAAGVTALLVTHDQAEALSMGDRVAVMFRGRIEQIGSPEEVYGRPASVEVGTFLGDANPVPGRAQGGRVTTALGVVDAEVPDGAVTVLLRPEDVELVVDAGSPDTVTDVDYMGADRLVTVVLASGDEVAARLSARQRVAVGDHVRLSASPDGPVVAFPA
jgi:iron(III) transport system ATP-binding protein